MNNTFFIILLFAVFATIVGAKSKQHKYEYDNTKRKITITKAKGKPIVIHKESQRTRIRGLKYGRSNRHRIQLFGGYGPSGKMNVADDKITVESNAVVGLGYSYKVEDHFEVGVMVFTNGTSGGTITFGF